MGITFAYTDGGLGGAANNNDHVSMVLFDGAAPLIWGTDAMRSFRSVKEAMDNAVIDTSELHHVSEFFRLSPFGKLYVGYGNLSAAQIFAYTNGEIRQIGVLKSHDELGALQVLANELDALGCPVVVVAGIEGVQSLADLTDLSNTNLPKVAAIAAGDGAAPYEPAYGLALGVLSVSRVHECIGWVEQFNVLDIATAAYSTVSLADGNLSTPEGLLDLADKHYNAITHYVGDSGAYFTDSLTAVASTSDYSTLENNRTIQKAVRGVYLALLPKINSPLYVDATSGKLDAVTIGDFQSSGQRPLAAMAADGEVSGYSVYVNPEQNVLATSKVEVVIKIVPVGVAREIAVTIGLTAKL